MVQTISLYTQKIQITIYLLRSAPRTQNFSKKIVNRKLGVFFQSPELLAHLSFSVRKPINKGSKFFWGYFFHIIIIYLFCFRLWCENTVDNLVTIIFVWFWCSAYWDGYSLTNQTIQFFVCYFTFWYIVNIFVST